ncbi:uncharacterized protein LOC135112294 isoform X3 [Scylla paramamosain]|uniref:uncharacterized protein LOC135112294 isoform X3 n=1 Tax=Scylla paramamosain TaxID=85552 RepID=UPI003083A326
MCSLHFSGADYKRDLKYELLNLPVPRYLQQLKEGTVPTLHPPSHEGIAALDPSTEEHGVLVETQPSQLKIEPMEEDTAGFSKNAPAVCGSHPVTTFNAKEAASQTSVCTSQPHMSGLTLSEALRFHKEKLQIDLANKANGAINLTVQAAPHIWEEGMQKQHASGSGNSIFNSTRKYAEANSGTKIEFEVDVDDKTVTSYPLHVIHNNPEYQPRLTSAVIEKGSLPSLKLHTNSQKASVVMILNYLEGATEASVTQENEVPSNTFSVTEDIVKEEIIDESELQGNEIFSNAFLVPEDIVKEETLDESVTHQNEVFK